MKNGPLVWSLKYFKKQNPRLHENYRPIMLLDTMYKIYTRLLADRLSKHVEPLLRKTQYGFRKHRSTAHAIHVVRRTMDALFHKAHIDLNLLLLDWSKAFDKVDTLALSDALIAFGVGGAFLKAIQNILKCQFRVLGQGGFPPPPCAPRAPELGKVAPCHHYYS